MFTLDKRMFGLTKKNRHGASSGDPYEFIRFDPFNPRERFRFFENGRRDGVLKITEYLTQSGAVRTPIEVYALWIELHVRQGGQIERVDSFPFDRSNMWMPTRESGLKIPESYGADALYLSMVPSLINQDMSATKRKTPRGWTYGHGSVFAFEMNRHGGILRAASYGIERAVTYPEVEWLRAGVDIDDLMARGLSILRQAYRH